MTDIGSPRKDFNDRESPKYSPASNEDPGAFLEYQQKYIEKVFAT